MTHQEVHLLYLVHANMSFCMSLHTRFSAESHDTRNLLASNLEIKRYSGELTKAVAMSPHTYFRAVCWRHVLHQASIRLECFLAVSERTRQLYSTVSMSCHVNRNMPGKTPSNYGQLTLSPPCTSWMWFSNLEREENVASLLSPHSSHCNIT